MHACIGQAAAPPTYPCFRWASHRLSVTICEPSLPWLSIKQAGLGRQWTCFLWLAGYTGKPRAVHIPEEPAKLKAVSTGESRLGGTGTGVWYTLPPLPSHACSTTYIYYFFSAGGAVNWNLAAVGIASKYAHRLDLKWVVVQCRSLFLTM